jgi:hypothetical protein
MWANRVSRHGRAATAAESPPKVSCLFYRLGRFVDKRFQTLNDTWSHVLVSISGEMNSIAVGHFFQFSQSFIDCCGSRNRGDAARVHDLKIGYTMADQLFYQLVFEPNETGHEYRLIVWIIGIGAVTTVTATAREQISGKRWQYYAWFVPSSLYNGRYSLHNFFENLRRGGYHLAGQMVFTITLERKWGGPVKLFKLFKINVNCYISETVWVSYKIPTDLSSLSIRLYTVKNGLPIMQNKHAPLEKLKIIKFKYLGNGWRYWKEILAVSYYTLEESFPELSFKNF